uniref:Mitochondrial ribosomal protein L12 n=1 Tax=Strix occidentalis caurina TaxID=311401 RepID=A0A8D0EX59_STROC
RLPLPRGRCGPSGRAGGALGWGRGRRRRSAPRRRGHRPAPASPRSPPPPPRVLGSPGAGSGAEPRGLPVALGGPHAGRDRAGRRALGPGRGSSPSSGCFQEEEVEIPLKKEKTHFTVRLTELKPADKVKLIKEVKNFVQGVNLVQAKKLVESLPQEIKANVSKQEAEKIKAALEAAGGTVVLE